MWLLRAKNRKASKKERFMSLLCAAREQGALEGMLIGAHFDQTALKRAFSDFGKKGAQTKNQPTEDLKTWALAQAAGMRDQDIAIARKLSAQIPEHLAGISKNPERLIYDALRAQRAPD